MKQRRRHQNGSQKEVWEVELTYLDSERRNDLLCLRNTSQICGQRIVRSSGDVKVPDGTGSSGQVGETFFADLVHGGRFECFMDDGGTGRELGLGSFRNIWSARKTLG